MRVRLGGSVDTSTIDFPKRLCSVIFFSGCPFRCPYCQNWHLLDEKNSTWTKIEDIISKLYSNPLIDALTVSGGEPTQQIEPLEELLKGAKNLGLATKIDTNGFYPNNIRRLLANDLLDYVAMDVKSPLQPDFYASVAGLPGRGFYIVKRIRESISILINSGIPLEIRTTVVPGLVDDSSDVELIAREIQGTTRYVLQQFRSDGGTLDPNLRELHPPTRDRLLNLAKSAATYLFDVRIRTVDKGEERVRI